MKSGLVVLLLCLAVIVAGLGYFIARDSRPPIVPNSAKSAPAHEPSSVQLAGEDPASAREVRGAPVAAPLVAAGPVAHTDLASAASPDAHAAEGSSDLNAKQGAQTAAPTHPDMEAKYANMSIEDLRSTFTQLQKILQTQNDGTEADKTRSDAVQLSAAEIAELVREAAWVKEHAYP